MEKILKRPKSRGRHRLWEHDAACCQEVPALIGVDEAGRGAFAGPVVAAAIWVDHAFFDNEKFKKVTKPMYDSKALAAVERAELLETIQSLEKQLVLRCASGMATAAEVEKYNVLGATRLAMQRSLENLDVLLEVQSNMLLFESRSHEAYPRVLIDGRMLKHFPYAHEGLVQGDARSLVIAMASIVAKVTRDKYMTALAKQYPSYGFDKHKGYGTKAHQAAIDCHGTIVEHRLSFIKGNPENFKTKLPNAQTEFNLARS